VTDLTPDELRSHRENVLLRLLLRVAQLETAELTERLQVRGHASVQAGWISLLGNVDTEGTRIVAIADRMGTTRQAVSQRVQAIERAGYLERVADPDDRRGVLVRHTKQGSALLTAALEVMGEIEVGYGEVLGRARLRALKEALKDIAESVPSDSALGRG